MSFGVTNREVRVELYPNRTYSFHIIQSPDQDPHPVRDTSNAEERYSAIASYMRDVQECLFVMERQLNHAVLLMDETSFNHYLPRGERNQTEVYALVCLVSFWKVAFEQIWAGLMQRRIAFVHYLDEVDAYGHERNYADDPTLYLEVESIHHDLLLMCDLMEDFQQEIPEVMAQHQGNFTEQMHNTFINAIPEDSIVTQLLLQ